MEKKCIYWMMCKGLLPEGVILSLRGLCRQFNLGFIKYKENICVNVITDALADICKNDKIISWKKYYNVFVSRMNDYYEDFEYEISNAKHPILIQDFFDISLKYPIHCVLYTLDRAMMNENVDFVIEFAKIFAKRYPIENRKIIPKHFYGIELYLAFVNSIYFIYGKGLGDMRLYKDPRCIQFLRDFIKVGPRVLTCSNKIRDAILHHTIILEMPEFLKYYTPMCDVKLLYSYYQPLSNSFKQLINPYIYFTTLENSMYGKINIEYDYDSLEHFNLWITTNHTKIEAIRWCHTTNRDVFANIVKYYRPDVNIFLLPISIEWYKYKYIQSRLNIDGHIHVIKQLKILTVDRLKWILLNIKKLVNGMDEYNKYVQFLFKEFLFSKDIDILKCLLENGASVKYICADDYLYPKFVKIIHFLLDNGLVMGEKEEKIFLERVKNECVSEPRDVCDLIKRIDYIRNIDVDSKKF